LYPPLILLGGIAQTKASWDHHLVSLARNRRVLVYECLGQGDHTIPVDADVDASLPAQAQILLETLDEVLVTDESKRKNDPVFVDIAGFSFGGRVAMATACLQNDRDRCDDNGVRIQRLHLTGVGCDRSDFGHLAMLSFPDIVRNDPSLRSFAWSILLATYSSGYLRSLPETTLERFLDHIASSNNLEGLLAILEQAEVKDMEDPWHVANMAGRLAELSRLQSNPNNNNTILGKLCVGEMDTMAPVDEVERLRDKSDWIKKEVDVLPDSGHAVVLEKPRAWRESVLSFLNDNNTDDGNGSI
jgi:pimeloyl-ACP methyl ester carboxylesterase